MKGLRFSCLVLVLVLVSGCIDSNQDLVIDLTSQDGYGPFLPGRVIIGPTQDSLIYKNVPQGINEYVVRRIIMQRSQYYWNKYIAGNIEKEKFDRLAKRYQIDKSKVTDLKVDTEVLFLVGRRSNKRVIIIDSNNDEDFANEEIFEYEYPMNKEQEKVIEKTLPSISIQYEYYENNQIITKESTVRPSPYKGSLGLKFNTENEIEKKYFLFASFPEYKKGNFEYNGIEYDVLVSNGFSRVNYNQKELYVFVTQKSNSLPSELDGDIPYSIGDSFNVSSHEIAIDSIANWGDKLYLRYIGENTKPVGLTEGYYLPDFEARYLDSSVFDLEQHKGKYILFDFWGTWCQPCIKLIPELKNLKNDFENEDFTLVSVAYDSNQEKVVDFVNSHEMDWTHLFINQKKKDDKSLIAKLRVTTFPTTILVDPYGKIIARNVEIKELKKLLAKEVNAL